MSKSALILSGISFRSLSLSAGIITVLMFPRCAAKQFFLQSTDSSAPALASVISPVIATSARTGIAGQGRHQSRTHADTGARPVFRGSPLWHVYVTVMLLMKISGQDPSDCRATPNNGESSLYRLLHYVAKRACLDSLTLAINGTASMVIAHHPQKSRLIR